MRMSSTSTAASPWPQSRISSSSRRQIIAGSFSSSDGLIRTASLWIFVGPCLRSRPLPSASVVLTTSSLVSERRQSRGVSGVSQNDVFVAQARDKHKQQHRQSTAATTRAAQGTQSSKSSSSHSERYERLRLRARLLLLARFPSWYAESWSSMADPAPDPAPPYAAATKSSYDGAVTLLFEKTRSSGPMWDRRRWLAFDFESRKPSQPRITFPIGQSSYMMDSTS
mmetsp:Transcript_10260/g.32434  ORF Transcript_10260/g.32434 Transcript_10260/m.32434 type:complete len:225 (-) Transcript_10260:83-757(-)